MLTQVQSTRPSRLPNLMSEISTPPREQAAMPDAEALAVARAEGEDATSPWRRALRTWVAGILPIYCNGTRSIRDARTTPDASAPPWWSLSASA